MPAEEIQDRDGHWLGPPVWHEGEHVVRALYGWSKCDCPDAQAARMGHATVRCKRPGCGWVHHDPPHEGQEWIRRVPATPPPGTPDTRH